MTKPRIGFAGAGGVGCYFGGLMALAGFDVTLVGRGEHIEQISRRGLALRINDVRHRIEPFVADTREPVSLNQLSDLDWLFITCKTHQTESMLDSIQPFLTDRTRIVSLQNGVDGPLKISRRLGRDVYGGLSIRFVAHVTGPGQVEVDGNGFIQFGRYPNGPDDAANTLWSMMQAAGVDVRVTNDIRRELWRKLIINNGVNPICALLERDCADVFADASTSELIDQMMLETAQAARVEDVFLTDEDIAGQRAIIQGLGAVKPSMLVDREHGRALELDTIAGAVIARAASRGMRVPVTETIDRLLRFSLEREQN